ncbi:Vacuolar import and degradation protein 27 [Cystobasidiomycetes sp. EMM_F5]
MNMIRSLYGKVIGTNAANQELAKIEGCFYLVRPTITVKGSKECLFQTATASIRSTSKPYQFELIAQRSVSGEEAQLLGEEAESEQSVSGKRFNTDVSPSLGVDEYYQLIDARMQFTIQPASAADSDSPDAIAYTYVDSVSEEDSYMLVVEDATKEEREEFEMTIYRCMWEVDNMADAKNVSRAELLQYRRFVEPQAPKPVAVPVTAATPKPRSTHTKTPSPIKKTPLFRAPSPSSSSDDEVADQLTSQIAKLQVSPGSARGQAASIASSPSKADSASSPPRRVSASPQPPIRTSYEDKGKSRDLNEYLATPALAPPSSGSAPLRGAQVAEAEPEPEADPAPSKQDISNATRDPPDGRQLLITETCDINLYDAATGMFMLQENAVVTSLWLVQHKDYSCWLSVAGNDGYVWISIAIKGGLPIHFDSGSCSVIVSIVNEKTDQSFTWLLKYNDRATYEKMNDAFTQGIFEANNGYGSWRKNKPDEQQYFRQIYAADVEMEDAEPYYEEEDEEPAQDPPLEELYSEEEESTETETDEDQPSGQTNGAKNSLLAVGYKGLSFVVRGDMIGVFENQKGTGKKLKFVTNIAGIAKPGSKTTFTPGKVMLHDQDMSMIISDPHNSSALYKLDLTTGKVVDEFKVKDGLDINNFLSDSKFAQTTQQQTFIGTSKNAIFRIDPRLSGSKLVESEFKQYAASTKTNFSAAATTEAGHLVVASDKGEVRLFDSIGKNAKTALPAFGQAIIGIDVSADGRYMVATTAKALLFIDTEITEGRYKGSSGFTRSFPANAKPQPKRLALKPEHELAIGSHQINFTTAKFNTAPGGLEKTIVTSTGPFVVAWNVRKIKAGQLFDYKIRRYDSDIVSDNFRFGDDREIIVTMPDDMRLESKSQLQSPTRQSLAGNLPKPRKSSNLRTGSVVQQWDG